MSWNYRILKQEYKEHNEIVFGIVECYTDEQGRIGYTDPITVTTTEENYKKVYAGS